MLYNMIWWWLFTIYSTFVTPPWFGTVIGQKFECRLSMRSINWAYIIFAVARYIQWLSNIGVFGYIHTYNRFNHTERKQFHMAPKKRKTAPAALEEERYNKVIHKQIYSTQHWKKHFPNNFQIVLAIWVCSPQPTTNDLQAAESTAPTTKAALWFQLFHALVRTSVVVVAVVYVMTRLAPTRAVEYWSIRVCNKFCYHCWRFTDVCTHTAWLSSAVERSVTSFQNRSRIHNNYIHFTLYYY